MRRYADVSMNCVLYKENVNNIKLVFEGKETLPPQANQRACTVNMKQGNSFIADSLGPDDAKGTQVSYAWFDNS